MRTIRAAAHPSFLSTGAPRNNTPIHPTVTFAAPQPTHHPQAQFGLSKNWLALPIVALGIWAGAENYSPGVKLQLNEGKFNSTLLKMDLPRYFDPSRIGRYSGKYRKLARQYVKYKEQGKNEALVPLTNGLDFSDDVLVRETLKVCNCVDTLSAQKTNFFAQLNPFKFKKPKKASDPKIPNRQKMPFSDDCYTTTFNNLAPETLLESPLFKPKEYKAVAKAIADNDLYGTFAAGITQKKIDDASDKGKIPKKTGVFKVETVMKVLTAIKETPCDK